MTAAADGGILATIVARRRQSARRAAAQRPLAQVRAAAERRPAARSLRQAMRAARRRFVIAEVKRASPSAGLLRADLDPGNLAIEYRDAGAGAISVLTETEFFRGSDADLDAVRGAVDLPVLRKDFIVEPYQVWESRALGADALLLIVRILGADRLPALLAESRAAGLGALVEVHDEAELDVAISSGADLIGVNSRDLDTLAVDLGTAERLGRRIPAAVTAVAESGIRDRADLDRLEAAGYQGFLIGERLVRSDNPGALLREWIG